MEKKYISYGWADEDEAPILVCASNRKEMLRYIKDGDFEGIWYEYDVGPNNELINSICLGPSECMRVRR